MQSLNQLPVNEIICDLKVFVSFSLQFQFLYIIPRKYIYAHPGTITLHSSQIQPNHVLSVWREDKLHD